MRSHVLAHWDPVPQNPGWYVEVWDQEGRYETDSMKIWFPLDVDEFMRADSLELSEALQRCYPCYYVEVEGC